MQALHMPQCETMLPFDMGHINPPALFWATTLKANVVHLFTYISAEQQTYTWIREPVEC